MNIKLSIFREFFATLITEDKFAFCQRQVFVCRAGEGISKVLFTLKMGNSPGKYYLPLKLRFPNKILFTIEMEDFSVR